MRSILTRHVSLLAFSVAALLTWTTAVSTAQAPPSGPLFLITEGGKFGFIDQSGKVVIPAKLDQASNFRDGLASARVGAKWGYIDGTGQFVIQPQFTFAGDFIDGRAAVNLGNKSAIIDRTGKILIDEFFEEVGQFSEGAFPIRLDRRWGFMDPNGKHLTDYAYSAVLPFTEGLAAVSVGGKYGFVDHQFKLVIQPQYTSASSFSEGLAAVRVDNMFWGYIDTTGKMVIPATLTAAFRFSGGRALIGRHDQSGVALWGFIDKAGKVVVEPQYRVAQGFSDGLAQITVNGKVGYIDPTGRAVIAPKYQWAADFSNGLAEVKLPDEGNRQAYIDKTGRIVWRSSTPNPNTAAPRPRRGAAVEIPSALPAPTAGSSSLVGTILDPSGKSVPGSSVVVATTSGAPIAETTSDERGQFRFAAVSPASYMVTVEKAGFQTARRALRLTSGQRLEVQLTLSVGQVFEDVTVTTVRGNVAEVTASPDFVTATDTDMLLRRNIGFLPLTLREEPGVSVQQTTTAQASPFVRGLTGQQVVNMVDGIRFNNSTFRPGANQYTALLDPAMTERVEIVHGPSAVQYGSDSLGGAVNVLTRAPRFSSAGPQASGGVSVVGGTANLSVGLGGWGFFQTNRWGIAVEGHTRRSEDLRTGQEVDSHSVVTRLLGLPSSVLGTKLEATGYREFGGTVKATYHSDKQGNFAFIYLNGTQDGVQRYDQLNGGLGNLIADFDPQILNFAVARYERPGLGVLDTVTASLSFNSQRDDRRSQSINNATGIFSRITEEFNRTNVMGYQAQATNLVGSRHELAFGGELYDEFIASRRTDLNYNAGTGGFTDSVAVRARFPDGSRYRTFGAFLQDRIDLVRDRLVGQFGIRYTGVHYHQTPQGNPVTAAGPTVPEFSTNLDDVTFNAGLVYAVNSNINITGSVNRGFRAPNVNDFASIGVSGLGFEVTTQEGQRLGGRTTRLDLVGGSQPIETLVPEQLYNFEGGVRIHGSRVGITVAGFDSELMNLIERRTLLLPSGAVGQVIGGQPITRQDATGAVFTPLSSTAVFVRANNTGHVRLRGIEGSVFGKLSRSLSVRANLSSVRGEDIESGKPPNLENGIPPTTGMAGLNWQPSGRYWLEAYSLFAFEQDRFSENDFSQARIGGNRTRAEIIAFFNNGAVVRGLVRNGILLETGETVDQVVRRVLGPDINARVPLYTSNPGFATVNLRGGFRFGERSNLTVILENLLDKNYRVMGSGIDGAGINLMVRQSVEF